MLSKKGYQRAHKEAYYRETVATTWNVSFKAIEQTDPLANVILRISAFLDGKQIQKDLFYDANLKVGEKESNISEWEVDESFGTLMSYSLVHPAKNKQCVEMHLLVQNVIRDVARTEQLQLFMASAELVDRRFPWGEDIDNLKRCMNYLSQAQTCLAYAQELQITSDIVIHLLESIAGYFQIVGQHVEALVSYERALKIRDYKFGVDHIRFCQHDHGHWHDVSESGQV